MWSLFFEPAPVAFIMVCYCSSGMCERGNLAKNMLGEGLKIKKTSIFIIGVVIKFMNLIVIVFEDKSFVLMNAIMYDTVR